MKNRQSEDGGIVGGRGVKEGSHEKRRKIRRKVSVSAPQPFSPVLVTVLVMGGILASVNAIMSDDHILWGVIGGGLFLAALFLVARSFVPVKVVR